MCSERSLGTSADRFCLSAVAAIGATLALYLIFELTFQISLPRGVLGNIIGF